MIARQPYLPRFMAGGPGNPLGARAMYLGNTEYRIHGTNAPSTIGQHVSSGLHPADQTRTSIDLFIRTLARRQGGGAPDERRRQVPSAPRSRRARQRVLDASETPRPRTGTRPPERSQRVRLAASGVLITSSRS
jgi:hypothetical protein